MKDTTNRLDYNVWSCGEYNNNVNGLSPSNDSIIQITNEYSNIGESSLKIIRKHETSTTAYIVRLSNLTGTNNINAILNIYTPNNATHVNLFNGQQLVSTTCPSSDTSYNINLDTTITSDYIDLRIFFSNKNDYCYIDNVKITY